MCSFLVFHFVKWDCRNRDCPIINRVNEAGTNGIFQLLNTSVKRNDREIVETLLEDSTDINAKNNERKTPIFYAIKNGDLNMTKKLLTNEANVKHIPELLHTAVKRGCIEIMEVLMLLYGADINCSDKKGFTALHFNSLPRYDNRKRCKTQRLKIAKLLLEHGANINAETANGLTPLHIAILSKNKEIVELYLKYGAKVDATTKMGETPLHYATFSGFLDIVKMLLEYDADVDLKNVDGKTALHIVCEIQHAEIAMILLEYGSDINIVSKNGCTPLNFAYCINDSFCNAEISDDFYDYRYYSYIPDQRGLVFYIEQHIFKLIAADLYVNTENLIQLKEKINSDICSSYKKEVEIMKSEKISDSNVSFYDFLKKDISHLVIYARNETIVQALQSDGYKSQFLHYASMINIRFKKAMKRKEFVEQGNKCFNSLFNTLPKLPYNCTEKIFSYFNDKDFKLLLDAFK